ncbi:MAG: HK97 gp10 family phage protein [Ignavibacteria bacterium]|nr:HK97 gp10 family phage protein [Ignavibacteria bacterium]
MIKGADKIRKNLKYFGSREQKKIFDTGVRKGATVILKRAKELVPVRSGELKRSLGVVKNKQLSRGENSGYSITTRRGKKFRGWYGHIVEFGYGRQRPQPFLRPAINETKAEVVKTVGDEIWNDMEKRLNR